MKKESLQLGLINSLVLLMLLVSACGQSVEQTDVILPFYNSADFTPEWISEDNQEYKDIHTIGEFSFLNQEGEVISNKTLSDKIYVADFFFTICPGICPKMTSNLSKVQEAFKDNMNVQLVSYSVMPWVDSVGKLREYAEIKGINKDQWNLLTGDKERIYELARNSYFAEKEIGLSKSTDEFLHTENFVLVDGLGRIRGVYNGTLPLEVTRLISDIKTLQKLG